MNPLFESAKIAGHSLYDSHQSGLIWFDGEEINHVNFKDIPIVKDEDDGDYHEYGHAHPIVDTYEYQFHPSSNTGVDCADELICTLTPDVDGNIFLYYPDGGIRVIHTKNDYKG